MTYLLKRLWWNLTLPKGWDTVDRTMSHPSLGTLRYHGTRLRPNGSVAGTWKLTPPGFAHPISVGFPTMGDEPTPLYLEQFESLLADLDGLFERFRPEVAEEYQQYTQTPLPADWRSVLRLDAIDLRPVGEDVEEDGEPWMVTYWCEEMLHWVVVHLEGDRVDYVSVDG
jgi:hypothetical protein